MSADTVPPPPPDARRRPAGDHALARLSSAVYARSWPAVAGHIAADGWELVATIDHAGSQAVLVQGDGRAVVAIRGTEASRRHWRDILANVGWPSWWAGPERAHSGYDRALARVRDRIRWHLVERVPSDVALVLTGHSLGGALSHLYAAWAGTRAARHNVAEVVTFGAPRALSPEATEPIEAPIRRYVVAGDPAPWWPPCLGFTQPAPAITLPAPSRWAGPLARHDVGSYVAGLVNPATTSSIRT